MQGNNVFIYLQNDDGNCTLVLYALQQRVLSLSAAVVRHFFLLNMLICQGAPPVPFLSIRGDSKQSPGIVRVLLVKNPILVGLFCNSALPI